MRYSTALAATASFILSVPAAAQTAAAAPDTASDAFTLGQITVVGAKTNDLTIGTSNLNAEAMLTFNRPTLDEAVNLIPGVTASNSGGSRNERLIFVRGFDRFQVPLSIDGIRVYLPADNRLDFGRFLTADVSEVQVAKGYASVLDGPGAMGGAINLVTRKPTKALEAEVGGTLNLDHDANYSGYNVFALLGTKHDQWYAQASFTRNFRDHWDLASGFRPTVNEDGSPRDFTRTADWRANVKVGFTPNATDEYSLSYTRQEGSKNAPLHITETSQQVRRFWSWPEWNIDSVYFLSTTALGEKATLKTRVYYNEFYNMLRSFNNASQTTQTTTGGSSGGPATFDSPYSDNAYGGAVQLDAKLTGRDTLSVAVHYRRDEHNERQISAPGIPTNVYEPNQRNVETTYSVAVENRLDVSDSLRLTLGASYDWRDTAQAEEYSGARGLYSFPLVNADGWNGQGRLDWTGGDGTNAYASVSSRVRFPTIFERFSSQFNNADPNPYLKPERATNFEVGGGRQFGPAHVSVAAFYSRLTDALVSIRNGTLNRRENIGSADYYGAELSLEAQITPALRIGGNYSYIHRTFDVGAAPIGGFIRQFQLTDVPEHKGFAYVSWRPVERLEIVPSLEVASSRTTVTAITANADAPTYYPTGSYANGAIRVDYAVLPQVTLGVGAKNLFDQNVVLTDGFPEPGRSFFLSVRAKY
ncbi:TonB-dependent receptor [Sphingobium sufflavum]|uniref:TonB-dependent receptor plug domain-containing protein n=1 Tax=Sphingobium sufflavum TaxID=1129547 RepID=UPI001F2EB412|nr:TonB-dependent receptor [Sphingobium sufflavum]MCE7797180.1 TonB-dependent receptor [Sphingobium sufflavum]